MLTSKDFAKASSYRSDFEELELELGHIPDYDEEQESEVGVIETKES